MALIICGYTSGAYNLWVYQLRIVGYHQKFMKNYFREFLYTLCENILGRRCRYSAQCYGTGETSFDFASLSAIILQLVYRPEVHLLMELGLNCCLCSEISKRQIHRRNNIHSIRLQFSHFLHSICHYTRCAKEPCTTWLSCRTIQWCVTIWTHCIFNFNTEGLGH